MFTYKSVHNFKSGSNLKTILHDNFEKYLKYKNLLYAFS